jgi:hypothetical protein
MSIRGDTFAEIKHLPHDLRSSDQVWTAVTNATMANREKWAATVVAGQFYQLMPSTDNTDEVRLVLVEHIFVPFSATGSRGVIQAIVLQIRKCSPCAISPFLGCRSYTVTNSVDNAPIKDIMRPVHMLHFCRGSATGSACLPAGPPHSAIRPKFFKMTTGFHSRDVGSIYLHNHYYIK